MNNEKIGLTLDLRGVDMVTPVDLLADGRTPWSKNFRLYAQQSDDRQVAVSSRKGPGFYIKPLVETLADSDTAATTGTQPVGVVKNVIAQKITIAAGGRINRLDLRISRGDNALGPVLVSLYEDSSGKPGRLLSQSSISSGSIGDTSDWLTARFHNAPIVTGDPIWAVLEIQDDGAGTYLVDAVDGAGDALFSDVSFAALQPVTWGINYRAYTTPDQRCKGAYRFNRENNTNITMAVYGTTMYALDPSTQEWKTVVTGLNANATHYSFTRADGKVFWVNGYDTLRTWDGTFSGSTATGLETITDAQLPTLSQVLLHKDRIFGVDANDKNKIVWSEEPGNPEGAALQWYKSWRSVDFWYIPAPKTGSPITGLVSFQDALIIFTQDSKYVLSGYDSGSFFLRQSTGAKGALGPKGITSDENFIYFVADDGFYEFNGSKDTNISETRIQPLFDGCPNKEDITLITWKNRVRWYMASKTSLYNDMCAIYSRGLGGEWEIDTGTYVDRAIEFDDATDAGELLEFSSLYAMPMLAEQEYNSLGAPIDFEYRLKYDSFGLPAQKKRLRRYYPILQGVDNTFKIQLAMDKDFQDSPRIKDVLMTVNGNLIGDFVIGDGTLLGGDKSFNLHRQSYSGSAYYWQLRVIRKGVNNRVAFTGAQYKYRIKRM